MNFEKNKIVDKSQNKIKIDIKSIKPHGVDQNGVGDCFFEASLASLANSERGRQIIAESIKSDDKGGYIVTFKGDISHKVKVSASDLSKNVANGNLGNSQLWANILETAFYKYDKIDEYAKHFPFKYQVEGVPFFTKVNQIYQAFELLENQPTTTMPTHFLDIDNFQLTLGKINKGNIARALNQALNVDHLPVVATSSAGFLTRFALPNSGPLEGGHVYSVLKYNAQQKYVVLRNPWGVNIGGPLSKIGATVDGVTSLPDGELGMSLNTFDKYITDVDIAGKNPVINDFQNIYYDNKNSLLDLKHAFLSGLNHNFKSSQNDLANFLKSQTALLSDSAFMLTDLSERPIKFLATNAINISYQLIKKYSVELNKAYQHVKLMNL